MFYLIMIQTRD